MKVSLDLENTEADETLYTIPKNIRGNTAHEVFGYIADTLKDFLQDRNLENESYQMAFAFNFPVEMTSLTSAISLTFTKEFSLPSVIGKEVGGFLQNAIDKLGLKIRICCILNDTVAALAAGVSRDPDCCLGMIVSVQEITMLIDANNVNSWSYQLCLGN
ncbi:unnamed protein product [Echinostoma caproni]|uniref:Phosphotransferase n=1 Tax=Echinostoma caproni TaxID=27848 RepID=A0A183ARX6_9TREM|nr:unnamed protein product [Echinostoma caproni]